MAVTAGRSSQGSYSAFERRGINTTIKPWIAYGNSPNIRVNYTKYINFTEGTSPTDVNYTTYINFTESTSPTCLPLDVNYIKYINFTESTSPTSLPLDAPKAVFMYRCLCTGVYVQVRVTVGDSGLCWCVHVTSFQHLRRCLCTGESYSWRLGSLLVCSCDVFPAPKAVFMYRWELQLATRVFVGVFMWRLSSANSHPCAFDLGAVGLILFRDPVLPSGKALGW